MDIHKEKGISQTNTQHPMEGKELPVRSVKKMPKRHFLGNPDNLFPIAYFLRQWSCCKVIRRV
jgi:hypothetical protein